MAELQIGLTLLVETALSVGTGGSAGVLADKTIVRTQLGALILPGSHLKGRLRHACEALARAKGIAVCRSPRPEAMCPHAAGVTAPCAICRLFGSPSYPGALTFGDLVYQDLAGADRLRPPALRPGVSINRRRRTAEEQRLFQIETSPPGGHVYFDRADAIYGHLPDAEAQPLTQLLLAGIAYVQQWGGGKSRGLGWTSATAHAQLNGERVALSAVAAALEQLQPEKEERTDG